MSDPFDLFTAFTLAGGVCLPPLFHDKASITLTDGSVFANQTFPANSFLRIDQAISSRQLIRRTVLIGDVRAVWLFEDPDGFTNVKCKWIAKPFGYNFTPANADGKRKMFDGTSISFDDVIKQLLEGKRLNASVSVSEDASVLTEYLAGFTAEESAEFQPPTLPEGGYDVDLAGCR